MQFPFHRPAFPHEGTKTRRRDIRRDIRRVLGTSNEDAPTLRQALLAADDLKRIIDLASGGRYGLAVVRLVGANEEGQLYRHGPLEDQVARSSQIHEPISATLARERELREGAENTWQDYR